MSIVLHISFGSCWGRMMWVPVGRMVRLWPIIFRCCINIGFHGMCMWVRGWCWSIFLWCMSVWPWRVIRYHWEMIICFGHMFMW